LAQYLTGEDFNEISPNQRIQVTPKSGAPDAYR
jgi:hypothetical protein